GQTRRCASRRALERSGIEVDRSVATLLVAGGEGDLPVEHDIAVVVDRMNEQYPIPLDQRRHCFPPEAHGNPVVDSVDSQGAHLDAIRELDVFEDRWAPREFLQDGFFIPALRRKDIA